MLQVLRAATVTMVAVVIMSLVTAEAHNITTILAKHPEFSTFNHYLSVTHLAAEINTRETITVCAVDNAGMASFLSQHLSLASIKNVLSLHVLLDYFDAKKLHQITNGTALAATMFQASSTASGSSDFVNITDPKGGKVAFGPDDNNDTLPATFVKSVQEIPYNISVIQISTILPNAEAEAPTLSPSQMNLTDGPSPSPKSRPLTPFRGDPPQTTRRGDGGERTGSKGWPIGERREARGGRSERRWSEGKRESERTRKGENSDRKMWKWERFLDGEGRVV